MKPWLVITTLIVLSTRLMAQESDLIPEQVRHKSWMKENNTLWPTKQDLIGGYNHLLPYIVPSPYQGNAGSCLFMSHTGITELLLNKYKGKKAIDLSERYFMNLQKAGIGDELISNWRTDTIRRLNSTGVHYANKDFRFSHGWYKSSASGRVYARENEAGASYGPRYNWIVDLDSITADPVSMPIFEREVIFADPEENQWNVGTAPRDIVTQIKNSFKKRQAPILVIYNHVGLWHAVMIAGYNDHADSRGCSFIARYSENMNKRATDFETEAGQTTDENERARLQLKARNFRRRGQAVQSRYEEMGGCRGKGVFYVRDSIHPAPHMPKYDFDPSHSGEEEHLNAPIVLRSYEWLEQLANHVVQIYVD